MSLWKFQLNILLNKKGDEIEIRQKKENKGIAKGGVIILYTFFVYYV